jgi:RNA polymerase sigma factor (sigma-70 family)
MAVARPPAARLPWQGSVRKRGRRYWPMLMLLHIAQTSHGNDSSARTQVDTLSAECERFIRDHERAILNYLWRMTGDEQTASDLTQEVFLRAWQHFDSIRRYDQPRAWLFRVATNLALTHLQRQPASTGGIAELDDEHGPADSDPAGRIAESDLGRHTLLQLPPKRRAALVLREV